MNAKTIKVFNKYYTYDPFVFAAYSHKINGFFLLREIYII